MPRRPPWRHTPGRSWQPGSAREGGLWPRPPRRCAFGHGPPAASLSQTSPPAVRKNRSAVRGGSLYDAQMEGHPTEKTGFGRAAHQSCASAGAQRDAKRGVAEALGAMERHGGGRWKRGGGNQRGTASRQWMRSGLCDTFPTRMARIWTLRLTFWIALNEILVSPQAHPSFAIVLSRQPYQTASQSLDSGHRAPPSCRKIPILAKPRSPRPSPPIALAGPPHNGRPPKPPYTQELPGPPRT